MSGKLFVSMLSAGAFLACGGCAPDVMPSPASCAVAAQYFGGMKPDSDGRKLAYTEEPESSALPLSGSGWTSIDGPEGGTPPAALIDKFNRTKLVSAIKYCPAIRAMLDKAGNPHGKAAESQPGGELLGVAAPVMSDDGAGALMVLSYRSQGSLMDRTLQYMRRDKSGRWVVAALHRF